jgi:phosphonopyruvate decarboxylase
MVYGIPCVFAVGWRGEPGVHDEPQHAFQGTVTRQMLEGCGLTVFGLTAATDTEEFAAILAQCAPLLLAGRSVAFLISKDGLSGGEAATHGKERRMTREGALEALLTHTPEDDLFVVTTGKASREVFELRERLHQPHGRDFLTVGSMGHAGMVALGLAKATPARTVWCVDGDGAMLMHLGALAVEAQQRATNLIHVVLNNGAHESVGGMPVAGGAFWFAPVAHAVGFEAVFTAESTAELAALATRVRETARRKLCFLEIMVSTGARADLGRPTQTPRQNLQSLMETIQNGGNPL